MLKGALLGTCNRRNKISRKRLKEKTKKFTRKKRYLSIIFDIRPAQITCILLSVFPRSHSINHVKPNSRSTSWVRASQHQASWPIIYWRAYVTCQWISIYDLYLILLLNLFLAGRSITNEHTKRWNQQLAGIGL